MVKTPYFERRKETGSASAVTIYLSKVPVSKVLKVEHFVATIYTTNPGDYTTAKFIYLGFEIAGINYELEGHDVQTASGSNPGCVVVKDFTIPEGARLFAYFEATSTSQIYEIVATGCLCDVKG